jgi:nucleotide-binding universal stress UspA family protein
MFHHLLVPTDGSELSLKAVKGAVAFARECGARITFFHARSNVPISLYGAGELINPATLEDLDTISKESSDRSLREASEIAAAAGVPSSSESVVNDLPYEAIIASAERHGCDLIFMSSHGRRGLGGFLIGSQTQRVLTHSPLPVLVFR